MRFDLSDSRNMAVIAYQIYKFFIIMLINKLHTFVLYAETKKYQRKEGYDRRSFKAYRLKHLKTN